MLMECGASFAVVAAPEQQWLVLRCAPARTMALAAALRDLGAWTPTWKRKRRLPRSPISKIVREAVIPGMVFLPSAHLYGLPAVPRIPYSPMRVPGEFGLIRVPDRQLEPLRSISERPLIPARKLPKVGSMVRFNAGPFQGLRGKVLSCTIRCAKVAVDGLSVPVDAPPSLLAIG